MRFGLPVLGSPRNGKRLRRRRDEEKLFPSIIARPMERCMENRQPLLVGGELAKRNLAERFVLFQVFLVIEPRG